MRLDILLVDEDRSTRASLREWCEEEVYQLTVAGSLAAARRSLEEASFDLVVVALELPDGDGLSLVRELEGSDQPETVVLTSAITLQAALDAMQRGAVDCIERPLERGRFRATLAGARRRAELRAELRSLRSELRDLGSFGRMIGASPAMQRLYELIEQVAPTDAPVLVSGETGTGKEVVARAIHELGRRAHGSFVPLNCAALPEGVIESELFGHEKGAFTGATRDRQGVFARADGGTLLLDEITEMPVELQPRLLRVLETNEFVPVGSESAERANFRLIATTNRDPAVAVQDGVLREDLLYRINVFPIELPPLRHRDGDAELIARRALERLNTDHGTDKRFAPSALEQLERHDWPGNVRELLNVVQRGYIEAGARIERLPLGGAGVSETPAVGIDRFVGRSIADVEKELILATLEACEGNKTRTAEALGISVKTLYTRLNRYGDDAEAVLRRIEATAAAAN